MNSAMGINRSFPLDFQKFAFTFTKLPAISNLEMLRKKER